ncbi:MAG: DUF4870 domain-containing protein [Pyrinomonadaceae bacterium]
MPKKFDTNPLDPEFPEKAKAAAAQTGGQGRVYTSPQKNPYSTSEFPTRPPSVTEDETRRFGEEEFQAYSFQGSNPPVAYQPAYAGQMNRASDRKVAKTGVPEKWLVGLPYLPFWIGFVAGLILLLVIPKEENKVRFHSAQGFAAQIAIMIISAILGVVGNITDSNFGSFLFGAVTTVMMIVFAIRAWKGKPVHIEIIDDLTNWLEEKIGPIQRS